MKRTIALAVAAVAALAVAAPAQAASSVVNVSASTYAAYTNNHSRCGTTNANGYTVNIPASVWARADADAVRYSHRTSPGRLLTGGSAVPTVDFRANQPTRRTLLLPGIGYYQQTNYLRTDDAFVPGFNGGSCSVFTQIRKTDPYGA